MTKNDADLPPAEALRRWNIGFIGPMPPEVPMYERLPDPALLIERLACSTEARLRTALAMLFLRHPELAELVPSVMERLPDTARAVLRRQYTAAVYLQRLWRAQLELYELEGPVLPDYFTSDLGLPHPDERHGKLGLRALTARSPYNLWASYDKMTHLLFDQLQREWTREHAGVG